jgi:hypothetical protein
MLRVEIQDLLDASIVRLEGRLAGDWADHVRMLMSRRHAGMRLVVDLTEVTFVDGLGEEVLWLLKRLGAEFVADTSYTLDVCKRLHLPLAGNDLSPTGSVGQSC